MPKPADLSGHRASTARRSHRPPRLSRARPGGWVRSPDHGQHDVPCLLAGFHVASRLDHVNQPVGPIDDRPILPRLDQFPEEANVVLCVTVVVRTLTSTSSALGRGRSTSSRRSTSGGPYRSWTTALTSGNLLRNFRCELSHRAPCEVPSAWRVASASRDRLRRCAVRSAASPTSSAAGGPPESAARSSSSCSPRARRQTARAPSR